MNESKFVDTKKRLGLSGFRLLYIQLFIHPALGHRKFALPISDDSIGCGKGSFLLQRSL
jgi:hypothetical protein